MPLPRKPVPPAPVLCTPRSKVLVALCALFTIAVPLAIIAAVILPHMGDGDANAATPDTKPASTDTTPATTASTTTPAPTAVTASPSTPVSGTAK